MRRTGTWRALFASALLVILWLALRPNPGGPDWFDHADKLRHAAAFAALWLVGYRAGGRGWRLALGLLVFGGLIEVLQSLTPDREPSLADVAADAVGLALGAVWTRWR
ncbi:VanZ family protein [Ideonella sp. 4Y16]|uniref:VanZ family protein n=1 Tax=Ideonella alba TaxID=2824118 RepID=A0A940YBH1_9BURK|nr:VanZ family protein [Ideonella alba]MBQ0929652.1 VanZ family protein [Ideonella alba]MBQ0941894.1 VanZ family protein [Ideonella alba]